MNTLAWQDFFHGQVRLGKRLFTPVELANATAVRRATLNVELSRLVKKGVLRRYAKGLYMPAHCTVPPEELLPHLDPYAYLTGAYALMRHGLITQVPGVMLAFTCRRHGRREVVTPGGRFEFATVRPPLYRREVQGLAGPELALCDLVYISLRRGLDPVGLYTFRGLDRLRFARLRQAARRYPATVRRKLQDVMGAQ